MLLKINSPIQEGETFFKRKHANQRIKVHQGGTLHMERMYASGGMVISVFHNYVTNKEESKYDSISAALEKYQAMREMREKSPDWVDEGMMPAILKAVRAAQRQESESRGLVEAMPDPSEEDIEKECGVISEQIAAARNRDPELDAEMTKLEKQNKSKA